MKNVPKLRFKEFTDKWGILKEKIKILSGNAYPLESYDSTGTLLIQGLNIYPGKLEIEKPIYISNNYKNNKHIIINKDDILLGLNRPIINNEVKICMFEKEKAYLYQRAGILNFNKDHINSKFFYQYLRSEKFKKELEKELVGSDQPYIKSDLFDIIKIFFTNIQEQEKIANFLSSVDKKISITEEKLNLFNEYKKGMMQKIFSQQLRFKDKNGNNYPEWEEKRLGELLLSGNKNRVNNTKQYQKITIKLNLKGIEKNFSEREMADIRPFYIRELNEIIIGKQNYFNGSIAIVTKEFDGCICSNAIMSFKVKEDNVKFIYSYISQKDYLKKRESLANGTGQKELSEKDFLNFTIQLPCLEEQQKIADFLSAIDNKIEKISDKLENLKEFKKGLLQQMFI